MLVLDRHPAAVYGCVYVGPNASSRSNEGPFCASAECRIGAATSLEKLVEWSRLWSGIGAPGARKPLVPAPDSTPQATPVGANSQPHLQYHSVLGSEGSLG